ncbi:pilus assembly protein PilM [Providencia vermicola]|uniref:pilus assembly protein PilM n=1 Tax=Providencia vermicola TaxID=333965 RepID=UPI0032DABF3A
MYTSKWNIGIDIYQNKIQLVATKQRRKYWSLCECWQQQLPFEITESSDPEQHQILLKVLTQWRQKLPKNCTVSIALPAVRTLKQQLSLPNQVHLQQPELSWYLQSQAKKCFPMNVHELAIDYRVINQHVYLNGARKADITFWQNLLTQSGFNLLAIDVAPVALRYVARHCQLPDDAWLVHYRQGEWLWSGPISLPTNYNHVLDNEITSLSQLLPHLNAESHASTLPVYLITDHPNIDQPLDITNSQTDHDCHAQWQSYRWELRQAFQHHNLKLPRQLGDFVIAAGLALRHGDI